MSTATEKDYELLAKLVARMVKIEDRENAMVKEDLFEGDSEEEAQAFHVLREEKDLVITGMRCWLRDNKQLLS